MPIKTIVAIIQSTQDCERVISSALPLAQRFGALLIGVHAEAMPMAYGSTIGFPDVEFMRVSAEMSAERSKELSRIFAARMQAADQEFEWRGLNSFSGDGALSGATVARAADLVIVAQRHPDASSEDAANIDAILYEAGRPVLVLPHSGAITTTFSRIIVAWNASREAARAAFDALPFIVEAETTEIVVVDPPRHDDPTMASGADIAAALSRHGANVTLATEASDGRSIDEVMQARVAATGSDLLVLGAYSHSWLREMLFGGTTRTVLQSTSVPTFMSR